LHWRDFTENICFIFLIFAENNFYKSCSMINEHILNIYKEQELGKELLLRKNGISDFPAKPANFYNIDIVILAGFKIKSLRGVHFSRTEGSQNQTPNSIFWTSTKV